MEKQNKNNELSDVNETPVEDKKPKKERSNASKMLTLFGGVIIGIMIFLIATGAWNPFKSQDIAKDAQEIVENSEEYYMDWVKFSVSADLDEKTAYEYYGPNDKYPYGGITTDYGKNGDMSGTVKKFKTTSTMYDSKFGGRFIQYVMKNEEYAKEKYKGFVNAKNSKKITLKEEKKFKNADVYTYYYGEQTNYYIRQGSIVYDFWGIAKDGQGVDQIPMTQTFFDYLKIDYKVPQPK